LNKNKQYKNDWKKLQKEFELYNLKNKGKTLKDFCKKKGLNYSSAKKQLSCKKAIEKIKSYEKQKAKSFTKTIKKRAVADGKKLALTYINKMNMGDELLEIIRNSVLNKIKKKEDFQSLEGAIKSFSQIIKSQTDLQKVEILTKNSIDPDTEIEKKEEENFFKKLLIAGEPKEINTQ